MKTLIIVEMLEPISQKNVDKVKEFLNKVEEGLRCTGTTECIKMVYPKGLMTYKVFEINDDENVKIEVKEFDSNESLG